MVFLLFFDFLVYLSHLVFNTFQGPSLYAVIENDQFYFSLYIEPIFSSLSAKESFSHSFVIPFSVSSLIYRSPFEVLYSVLLANLFPVSITIDCSVS